MNEPGVGLSLDLGLRDEVILVTGGASGIGSACVALLRHMGAHVVSADLSHAEDRHHVQADVTVPEDAERMVGHVIKHHGRLDGAVNCAGVGVRDKQPVSETDVAEWQRIVEANLSGVFLSMRAELRAMTSGAAIVNIASVMSQTSSPGSSPYVAAKHGVVGLTKTAAVESAPQGVRINALGPGFVDTPLLKANTSAFLELVQSAVPAGRLAHPNEIAHVAAFLLSPAATYMTGAFVPVDGGFLAR